MKKFLLAIGTAAICTAGLAASKDAVPARISGCVHDGHDGSFVFTNVVDLNENAAAPASAVYWLSSTKGLKDHVGHKVEVTGTYSPSRDAGKTAKIKIETDAKDGEMKVAVENGMKTASFDQPIASGTSGAVGTSGVVGASAATDSAIQPVGDSKLEIVKPYRRLEVQSVKMIAASCQ